MVVIASQKKVLLYLSSNSPFYTNLYPSIKRGFEEAGCEVRGGATLLDAKSLIQEIEVFRPDFVFEMNRVKSEIEDFPNGVIHICWLVDFWGRQHEALYGSDILYAWYDDWVELFEMAGVCPVFYLPPATDATIYRPLELEKVYDFIFLGHISNHWAQKELDRAVCFRNGEMLFFKDLLPYIKRFVLLRKTDGTSVLDFLKEHGIILNTPIERVILYDISSRAIRQIRREHYMDMFLALNRNIAIYGSENWLEYDRYKALYKGYISSPIEINRAIGKANILLHDDSYPHFRMFDAMAAGVVVAPFCYSLDGVRSPMERIGFKEGEDYLNVEMHSSKVDGRRFGDSALLEEIVNNARKKVLNKHLWVHRARKVLADIRNL